MTEPREHDGAAAPPSRKSDNATVAQRVQEVLRIRLDGAEFHDIVQYASEQKWGVGERQLWNYVHKADGLLVERQERSRRRLLARHVGQRQALYARCVNAADFRTALAVLADLAKLRGVYPDRELRELKQLAVTQGQRLRELEGLLRAAGLAEEPASRAGAPPITLEEAKRIAREAVAEVLIDFKEPPPLIEPPLDNNSPAPDDTEAGLLVE